MLCPIWTLEVGIFCGTAYVRQNKGFVATKEFGPTATYLPANLRADLAGNEQLFIRSTLI